MHEKNEKKQYQVDQRGYAQVMECRSGASEEGIHAHHLKAFTRLNCFPEMLLYGKAKDSPDVSVKSALKYFSDRFPKFVIALYSQGKVFMRSRRKDISLPRALFFKNEEEAIIWLRERIGRIVSERFESSIEWGEEYWETYFENSNIENRRNMKQQRQRMPEWFFEKESIEYKSLMDKRIKPNTKLSEFV